MEECEALQEFYGSEYFSYEKNGENDIEGLFIGTPSVTLPVLIIAPKTHNYERNFVLSPIPKPYLQSESLLAYSVSYLPPIFVKFAAKFSDGSPSLSFSLRSSWLDANQLASVKENIQKVCSEDTVTPLSSSCGFIQHDLLSLLFPGSVADHECVIDFSGITSHDYKLQAILEHNENVLREVSPDKTYECEVCTECGLGSNFLRFVSCGHLFCRKCIASAFESQIDNGINGGRPTCLSCDAEAAQFEVDAIFL